MDLVAFPPVCLPSPGESFEGSDGTIAHPYMWNENISNTNSQGFNLGSDDEKNAYQDLLSTFTTTIVVYGDSNLNVGDVILIDLPETAAGEDKADSIYSGDWFVSAVTHSIDAERMNTTLEITKSGLKKIHTNSPR